MKNLLFLFFKDYCFPLCECLHIGMRASAYGGQQRAPGTLDLEVQAVYEHSIGSGNQIQGLWKGLQALQTLPPLKSSLRDITDCKKVF